MCPYRIEVKELTHKLELHDFFEYYEQLSHQIAAINELQEAINKADPTILQSDAQWYETWRVDGKMQSMQVFCALCGSSLSDHQATRLIHGERPLD